MSSFATRDKVTIFVALMDEGTEVWRPVTAERIFDDRYLLVGICDTDVETWQFPPGSMVRCERRRFAGGEWALVAVELVPGGG